MKRHSRFRWAHILLSSIVMGGSSFVAVRLLTDLPIATVAVISLTFVLVGDIALALLMQAISPTHVTLGPGERWHKAEVPLELGTVVHRFDDRHGKVSIRGETWRARQTNGCAERLHPGNRVRIVERDGLTLIVTAAER